LPPRRRAPMNTFLGPVRIGASCRGCRGSLASQTILRDDGERVGLNHRLNDPNCRTAIHGRLDYPQGGSLGTTRPTPYPIPPPDTWSILLWHRAPRAASVRVWVLCHVAPHPTAPPRPRERPTPFCVGYALVPMRPSKGICWRPFIHTTQRRLQGCVRSHLTRRADTSPCPGRDTVWELHKHQDRRPNSSAVNAAPETAS